MERVAWNDQQYRGCVVFPVREGLLYATDAPFAKNYIYLMNPDTMELKRIAPIDGSCIYGCQCGDQFVFSLRWNRTEGIALYSSSLRAVSEGLASRICMCISIVEIWKRDLGRSTRRGRIFGLMRFSLVSFVFLLGGMMQILYIFSLLATNKNDLSLLALDLSGK